MMTRRTVLGAGLAFTAAACTTAFGADDPSAHRGREARSIDALLIDETIEMPRRMSTYIGAARQSLPVVGIQLDAASHAGLMGVLNKSQAIVGISSGATLFCLERIAWDHGFRLTERSQRCAGDPGEDTSWRDVAGLLSGVNPLVASRSPDVRTYRPSRADGTLHVWAMLKHAGPQLDHGRQDVQS
jgi:hypothetical protein